ncbi:uncharacterized protein EMH_0050630 [Eimeria mitis]|uniref:Uncharacterized protein n=1 Tax=Eimeria mitis TaxID=44415 RepID=U6KKL5_9EIME|nr:uncharacterized protein EMH_0050630 [Eimeria mitis]CDJ35993.1 hypothetical protein EMH_0050630 [Eimeria mitis]
MPRESFPTDLLPGQILDGCSVNLLKLALDRIFSALSRANSTEEDDLRRLEKQAAGKYLLLYNWLQLQQQARHDDPQKFPEQRSQEEHQGQDSLSIMEKQKLMLESRLAVELEVLTTLQQQRRLLEAYEKKVKQQQQQSLRAMDLIQGEKIALHTSATPAEILQDVVARLHQRERRLHVQLRREQHLQQILHIVLRRCVHLQQQIEDLKQQREQLLLICRVGDEELRRREVSAPALREMRRTGLQTVLRSPWRIPVVVAHDDAGCEAFAMHGWLRQVKDLPDAPAPCSSSVRTGTGSTMNSSRCSAKTAFKPSGEHRGQPSLARGSFARSMRRCDGDVRRQNPPLSRQRAPTPEGLVALQLKQQQQQEQTQKQQQDLDLDVTGTETTQQQQSDGNDPLAGIPLEEGCYGLELADGGSNDSVKPDQNLMMDIGDFQQTESELQLANERKRRELLLHHKELQELERCIYEAMAYEEGAGALGPFEPPQQQQHLAAEMHRRSCRLLELCSLLAPDAEQRQKHEERQKHVNESPQTQPAEAELRLLRQTHATLAALLDDRLQGWSSAQQQHQKERQYIELAEQLQQLEQLSSLTPHARRAVGCILGEPYHCREDPPQQQDYQISWRQQRQHRHQEVMFAAALREVEDFVLWRLDELQQQQEKARQQQQQREEDEREQQQHAQPLQRQNLQHKADIRPQPASTQEGEQQTIPERSEANPEREFSYRQLWQGVDLLQTAVQSISAAKPDCTETRKCNSNSSKKWEAQAMLSPRWSPVYALFCPTLGIAAAASGGDLFSCSAQQLLPCTSAPAAGPEDTNVSTTADAAGSYRMGAAEAPPTVAAAPASGASAAAVVADSCFRPFESGQLREEKLHQEGAANGGVFAAAAMREPAFQAPTLLTSGMCIGAAISAQKEPTTTGIPGQQRHQRH